MPKKTQEDMAMASPEMIFKPPPRRTYDNFEGIGEGSEPRRSDEAPHPRLSSKKSSTVPRNPAPKGNPAANLEGRSAPPAKEVKAKRKGSGLAQKHSHEDLKGLTNIEDLAAPFRDHEARRKVGQPSRKSVPLRAPLPQRVSKAAASKASKVGKEGPAPDPASAGSMSPRSAATEEQDPAGDWDFVLAEESQEVPSTPAEAREQPQKRRTLQAEVLAPISIQPELPQEKSKKKAKEKSQQKSLGSKTLSLWSQVTANFPPMWPSTPRTQSQSSASASPSGEFDPSVHDMDQDQDEEANLLKAQSAEALNAFHAALEEGTQPVQTVKLCFVGHARAGKTSTLRSLADRPFDPEQKSTHGVETCTFAKELMSAAPSRTTSSTGNNEDVSPSQPWLEMEGEGSVAKLLEEKVAMAVADNMKAAARLDRGQRSAASRTKDLPRTASEAPDVAEGPSLVKMPVDLIARAISSSSRNDAEPKKDVIMQTWDFAGQQMYYNMAHVFLTSCGIYALVLDLSTWDEGTALESMDFWLAALLVHAPDAWLVIVGSHADKLEDCHRWEVYRRIDEVLVERLQQAHQHAHVLGNEADSLLFFPVDNRRESAESQRGIAHLREALNRLAVDVAEGREAIPTRWAHFFHVLESQTQEKPSMPYIKMDQCRTQAADMGIRGGHGEEPGELEEFLGLFHKLGQLLYFEGSPAVVLSPQWLLDAMAQVVGCPTVLACHPRETKALHSKGNLSKELLEVLWKDERFVGHKDVLQAFLEHFDLLVPGSDPGQEGWLVPSLLPRRPLDRLRPRPEEQVVFVLDFKGAFKRLLPTLIPRLLCQLRKRYTTTLQVINAFGDFAQLKLTLPAALVTFDMYPEEAPEVLRVEVSCADASGPTNLEELLDSLHAAMEAWLPHVSYDTKLPCPCGAAVQQTGGHLLELSDVLANVPLYCRHSAGWVPGDLLPAAIRAWRERPSGAANTASAAERPFVYMYSSPLLTKPDQFPQQSLHARYRFPQLNVHKEFETLQGLLVGCTTQVATYESLENALQMKPAPSVLHVSCHSLPLPISAQTPSAPRGPLVRQYLVLENKEGCGHLLDAEGLRQMGGWENLGLLVLLACNSVAVAQELPCRAICCTNIVSDSAVRAFCRSLYLHLFSGQTVEEAFQRGQYALKNHADTGLRAEADRFLLLSPSGKEASVFTPPRCSEGCESSQWPTTPPVEKYRLQALDLISIVAKLSEKRVVLLKGPAGAGKTTFCRFFCRYFGAPGRLFADGVALLGAKETELLFKKDGSLENLLAKTVLDALNVQAWADDALSTLTSLRRLRTGRWLLVLDGIDSFQSENDMERLRKPLEGLLSTCTKLCVVLTSRNSREGDARPEQLAQLDGHKVVPHALSPLSGEDSAELFLDRIVRKLHTRDFDLADLSPTLLQDRLETVRRLRTSPLLKELAGVPGDIVQAAAWVDSKLPSLLQHPCLTTARRNLG